MDVDLTPTAWGGWIARTPADHRFRLAAVEQTPTEARRKLTEAVAAWERMAEQYDGQDA